MSLVGGVRCIGFVSIVLGALVVGISIWMLKDTYEFRQSWRGQAGQTITSIGLGSSKLDTDDKLHKIKLWLSSVCLAAGALQVITSLFLLFCSSSKGRVSARLWLFVNLFVILACAGSVICILLQQGFMDDLTDKNRDTNHQLKAFLAATGSDAIFLFIFSFITGAFGCRSG